MKKLAFFSILLISIGFASASFAECKLDTCGMTASNPANEYFKIDATRCYECSNSKCPHGYVAYKKISSDNYDIKQCDTSGIGNAWVKYTPGLCDLESKKYENKANEDYENVNPLKKYDFMGSSASYGIGKNDGNGIAASGTTVCYYYECPEGFNVDHKNKKCVEKGKASCEANTAMKWENGTCVCKKHPVEQVVNGKCVNVELEKQKQKEKDDKNAAWLAARKAECKAASATSAFWSPTLNKCDCSDKSKLWSDSQKQCVEKSADCDVATISWLHEMQLKYNDADITKAIVNILDFCTKNSSNRSQTELENNITNLKVLIQNYENAKIQKSKEITDSANNIKLLYGNISGLKNEASVWKDKEGDFNKSRLISDSVAGVVLGTAGGLITSSVIKKNQTENGFEDISCTVGGQVVAGWNDEFTVGIR